MKKKFLFFSVLSIMTMQTIQAEPFLFGDQEKMQVTVNNRILAKVNGKVISVVDLMKKMDMLFYRQFPEYASSSQARFQFYQINWKHLLKELIDKELIVADAEEAKIQVSAGDVRQEIESLFGPNIIANLDKIGLTFDEATKMVQSDIIIRRMLYFRVHAKALRQITPQVVRNFYETKYSKENIREKEWQYQVVSIRAKDAAKAGQVAQLVHDLLVNQEATLETLQEKLKEKEILANARAPSVNVSEEYKHSEKEISSAYKEILSKQELGSYSQPFSQKSRSDNSTVVRILFLKSMSPGGVIPLSEIENQLRDKLVDIAVEKETDIYLTKLRKHFDVRENQLNEMVSEDFEPFALK